ncbi:hypothetical protein SAMN05443665_102397 [Actinomadura meyerae]|uniref:Uncharacterized protein n=1 Tax=Actinomadura meyerae TaxID=240840 RepID=A0A239LMY9_9ACTN|nr:hypothetical protein [Actinomadura meyerae]SNT32047.1 hypothetical protein SAMN05443665_102397 [Actinomadura meyerae]
MVDGAVLAATALSLLAVPRWTRCRARGGNRRVRRGSERRARRLVRPETLLGLVVALVYLNQVLFTVYVLRVHGGDASFIARYLPEGWFALADGSAMRALAEHFPAPGLLAPSVLRVQAFLELPLVLLAYATVLRWLDHGWYRRLTGSWSVWAASVSYTFVFCVVEWDLHNPYTVDDIAIRVCSAVATPLLLLWLADHEDDAPEHSSSSEQSSRAEQPSFAQMLLFAVSVWALGHLVLTVYDTALLYNLGHLGGRLPGAVIAVCALVAARLASSRVRGGEPGVALASVTSGLKWALVLFFVPALAVRYGVNFGTPLVAVAAALAICLAAALRVRRETLSGVGAGRVALWAGQVATALLAAAAAGFAALRLVTDTYYEAGLLRAAGIAFAVAVAVCAATDRWLTRRSETAAVP